MKQFTRGQKTKLSDIGIGNILRVYMENTVPKGLTIDYSCFGLDKDGKLSDDRYLTFFNQPTTPCGAVNGNYQPCVTTFKIDLSKLPQTIEKLVFTAALDGAGTMSQITDTICALDCGDDRSTAELKLVGSDFALERALMVGELYRKDGIWRFAAVGQGFNGGLDALVKHFGGEVAEESAPVVVQEAAKPKLSLEKKVAEKAPGLVNLAKKAQVCLEKKNLDNVKGRVAIVLDASGSMSNQYSSGKVQEVIERILPLAVHFDDDGSLDCWAFADREKRLEPVTLSNYKNYVRDIAKIKQYGGDIGIGCCNNEPRAIKDVMDFFIKENPSKLPTYVVFITDGGIGSDSEIKKLIVDAAKYPIFWQFVGIGGSSYGILKKLDDMSGRVVDNCNFFELDRLSSVSEDQLYNLLLEEFPGWIKEATKKGII